MIGCEFVEMGQQFCIVFDCCFDVCIGLIGVVVVCDQDYFVVCFCELFELGQGLELVEEVGCVGQQYGFDFVCFWQVGCFGEQVGVDEFVQCQFVGFDCGVVGGVDCGEVWVFFVCVVFGFDVVDQILDVVGWVDDYVDGDFDVEDFFEQVGESQCCK